MWAGPTHALLVLGGCCGLDAELQISDPDRLAAAEDVDWIADQFAAFVDITGGDRTCVDEVRVIPGRYEDGMESMVGGRYVRRGGKTWIELTEEVVINRAEAGFRHELCHALDDQEGFSERYAELFDPADHAGATDGYRVPNSDPEAEVFALLCDDGPPPIYDIYGASMCVGDLDAWKYMMSDEVYAERRDRPQDPGPAVELSVEWFEQMPDWMRADQWQVLGGRLVVVTWSTTTEQSELMFMDVDSVDMVALDPPWGDDAWRLWPGLNGEVWMVGREAMALLSDDGVPGESIPLAQEIAEADPVVVLDSGRVLAYVEDSYEGYVDASGVYEPSTGARLLDLEAIWADRNGYYLADGEVWVPSADFVHGGLYQLTDEGWVLRPGPVFSDPVVLHHQGELLRRWRTRAGVENVAGGLMIQHDGGSWTPLGVDPCSSDLLSWGLQDVGERILVFDGVENRVGWGDLSL